MRALFGGRLGWRFFLFALQLIDVADDHKHCKGHDDEGNNGVYERAVVQRHRACGFGIR